MSVAAEKQTVLLFDETYTVITDEPRERLVRAAQCLNRSLKDMGGEAASNKSRAIVLCALQVALECERLKEQVHQAKQREDSLAALIDHTLVTPS